MYVSSLCQRRARVSLVGVALFLSGCWTPPSASVHPTAEPGIIQRGIAVERVLDAATVASVDPVARTVGLSESGAPLGVYAIGRGVRNWGDIRIGDRVHAEIEDVLTVYVAAAGAPSRSPDARVLVIDPSYRLLTLQYPKGERETLKIGLHTPMSGIEPGDSVTIRRAEVVELRVRRHSDRQRISRSRKSAALTH